MKLHDSPPVHLTYCLNIHPGESWAENFAAVRTHALAVKRLVAPDVPFGLGLRLSAQAARELAAAEVLAEFRAFLDENDLYVFTINGFPYGSFHGTRVKEGVYRPDWRSHERLDYTCRLADILAELLPQGVTGSISTVPGAYKAWITDERDLREMEDNLLACAGHLARIRERTGKDVSLALEPEPDCFIETTDEAIAFFASPRVAGSDAARRHLGICLDVCHLAVEFEEPEQSLKRLVDAGIRVPKVQLSSAITCTPTAAARERLRAFCDPVYLHQVKARSAAGEIVSYADLAEALATPAQPGETWRVHFHVPLFVAEYGELRATSTLYTPALAAALTAGATEHLEIETYTFDVLPAELRATDVTQNIAREFAWTLDFLGVR